MRFLPQVENTISNFNVWDEPKHINQFIFQKIDVEPLLTQAVLSKKSNLTDLIQAGGMGFSFNLLISERFKQILEKVKLTGIQFFQTSVLQNGIEYDNYFLLHPFELGFEYIDYSNSEIYLMKNAFEKVERLKKWKD